MKKLSPKQQQQLNEVRRLISMNARITKSGGFFTALQRENEAKAWPMMCALREIGVTNFFSSKDRRCEVSAPITIAEIMANARRPQVGDPEINPPAGKAIKRAPVPVLERLALALGVLGLLLSSGLIGWTLCEISTK